MNKYSEAIKADILNAANIIASCIQLGVIEDVRIDDHLTIRVNEGIFPDLTKGFNVVKDESYVSSYYEMHLVDFGSWVLCSRQDKPEETNE